MAEQGPVSAPVRLMRRPVTNNLGTQSGPGLSHYLSLTKKGLYFSQEHRKSVLGPGIVMINRTLFKC